MKTVAIIDYNSGNVRSVYNAITRLGHQCIITDDADEINSADSIIFPGVGEASSAMQYLKERGLDEAIKSATVPLLGICLGMQLLCMHSEEGNTDCLGIFKTCVKQFPPKDKVPHMGWNNFTDVNGSLFNNVVASQDVYYVHSYYAEICDNTIATCDYILPFSASMVSDNFYATQFHPEKSANVGEEILKNFLKL